MLELHDFFVLRCGTCRAISVRGGFRPGIDPTGPSPVRYESLYPVGPEILPARHTLASAAPVPAEVLRAYRQSWPLRHSAPNAFANQIRRTLEFVCKERGASGHSLGAQLRDLANRGVFAPEIADLGDLIRDVGNRGSHADSRNVDRWDAELMDELFRHVVRALYVVPSLAARMRQRLSP